MALRAPRRDTGAAVAVNPAPPYVQQAVRCYWTALWTAPLAMSRRRHGRWVRTLRTVTRSARTAHGGPAPAEPGRDGMGVAASQAARPIRANSILPANRTDIELHTAHGLTLVGELALPVAGQPVATLVCLHPLPTHGGTMDSHILRKAAWRLPALAGIAVLRFNTRGTTSERGTSDGAFDGGVGERFDVAAAIEYAEFADLPDIWLLGWSFGADLVLRYVTPDDLEVWRASGKPVTALVPELDDYLRPDAARARFAAIPQAEVVGVAGAQHFWVG